MRLNQARLVTNGDMSGAINSIGIDLNQHVLYSMQAVFTGAPAGTMKLQISNDMVSVAPNGQSPEANVINWTDYTGSSVAVSAAGNFVWNALDVGYRWVRMVYTPSSGTGVLNVTFCGKAV